MSVPEMHNPKRGRIRCFRVILSRRRQAKATSEIYYAELV